MGSERDQVGVRRLVLPAVALLIAQVVHGAVPADTSAEGSVGFYVGILLLVLTVAGLVGATQRSRWAVPVLLGTGAFVAVGFVAYHAVPVTSPVSNPYPGEGVGWAPWATVVVSVAAGAWVAWEAWRLRDPVAQPAAG